MQRGLVLVDVGEPTDGFAKDVVGQVIVDRADLADQHIPPVAPERMPVARHQRHAFPGGQPQLLPRTIGRADAVAHHHPAPVLRKLALIIRAIQLDHQRRPAPVDDVLGLDDMGVHRRQLVLPADQQLFGIAHAAPALQVGQPPIAQGEEEQAHLVEPTLPIVGDVPAAPRRHDGPGIRARLELVRRPIGKGRQHEPVLPDQIVRRAHDVVDP